jgi:hypothetical protein
LAYPKTIHDLVFQLWKHGRAQNNLEDEDIHGAYRHSLLHELILGLFDGLRLKEHRPPERP